MGRNFDFIVLTGPVNSNDPQFKSEVRSKSMRAFRRSERAKRVREHTLSKSTAVGSPRSCSTIAPSDECDSEVITEIPRQVVKHTDATLFQHASRTVSLRTNPSAASIDPFATTTLQLPRNHQALMSHFNVNIGPQLIPINPTSSETSWTTLWLSRAISNPVLLAATCHHASVHLDALCGREASRTSLQLRQLTLQSLNKALHDESSMASDETIGALSLLIADMILAGNTSELLLHISALRKMISMRKRPSTNQRASFEEVLDMTLDWHYAPTTVLLVNAKGSDAETLDPPTHGSIYDVDHAGALFFQLVEQARSLTIQMENARETRSTSWTQLMEFGNGRSALESTLIGQWLALASSSTIDFWSNVLVISGCLALLIYTFTHLRRFTTQGSIARVLSKRLSLELSLAAAETFERPMTPKTSALLFWLCAVAIYSSGDSDNLNQIERLMTSTIRVLGLKTKADIEGVLNQFAWTPKMWTLKAQHVVDEILCT